METIISPLQQRAIDYCDRKQMPKIGRQIAVIAYMHGAEEQDRIARAEERERCIKAAQKWWCKTHCSDYSRCINGLGDRRILLEECRARFELSEAIEEGGGGEV